MSRTPLHPVVVSVLLALLIACGHFAVAGAESLEDAIAGVLTPSAAPAMLGPITSAGRTGWECKPERAASSTGWRQAELPAGAGNP
ncbi:MAG TPA: hypothetical protein VGG51_07085 [Candidatus Cybelea sp.]